VSITKWNEKKSKIRTNIELRPTKENDLTKKSIADCLQTRPIDHRFGLTKMRGKLSTVIMQEIDQALKLDFDLS
jgi:mRNA interferase MazF